MRARRERYGDRPVQRPHHVDQPDTRPRFVTLLVCAGLLMALAPDLSDVGNIRKRELFVAGGGILRKDLPHGFEYPVLAKVLYLGERAVSSTVFGVTVVNIFVGIAGALVVYYLLRRARADTAVWCLAPTLLLAAQNIDAWAAVVIVGIVMLWEASQWAGAGALGGIGLAFKLSPAVVMPTLAAATTRTRALAMAVAGVAVWLVCNVPYYLHDSTAWRVPYKVASERDDTKGTIWAILPLHGRDVSIASTIAAALIIGLLTWAVATRRIDPWSASALAMLAFLATNKVWQPHYILWLLPLLAFSGVDRLPLRSLEVVNLAYFVVIWGQMDFIDPTHQGPRISAEPWTTITATLRLLCACWLAWSLWRQGVERARQAELATVATG